MEPSLNTDIRLRKRIGSSGHRRERAFSPRSLTLSLTKLSGCLPSRSYTLFERVTHKVYTFKNLMALRMEFFVILFIWLAQAEGAGIGFFLCGFCAQSFLVGSWNYPAGLARSPPLSLCFLSHAGSAGTPASFINVLLETPFPLHLPFLQEDFLSVDTVKVFMQSLLLH